MGQRGGETLFRICLRSPGDLGISTYICPFLTAVGRAMLVLNSLLCLQGASFVDLIPHGRQFIATAEIAPGSKLSILPTRKHCTEINLIMLLLLPLRLC